MCCNSLFFFFFFFFILTPCTYIWSCPCVEVSHIRRYTHPSHIQVSIHTCMSTRTRTLLLNLLTYIHTYMYMYMYLCTRSHARSVSRSVPSAPMHVCTYVHIYTYLHTYILSTPTSQTLPPTFSARSRIDLHSYTYVHVLAGRHAHRVSGSASVCMYVYLYKFTQIYGFIYFVECRTYRTALRRIWITDPYRRYTWLGIEMVYIYGTCVYIELCLGMRAGREGLDISWLVRDIWMDGWMGMEVGR